MPKKPGRGETPCRSCTTLTVVLLTLLAGVLPGSNSAVELGPTAPVSTVEVVSAS